MFMIWNFVLVFLGESTTMKEQVAVRSNMLQCWGTLFVGQALLSAGCCSDFEHAELVRRLRNAIDNLL